jgi:hypothetical protein
VTADFPKARTPDPKEKAADKAKLDGEFANQQKALHDKLVTEQQYEKWVYLVPKSWADRLLVKRETLLQPKPAPTPAPSPTASAATAPPMLKKPKKH